MYNHAGKAQVINAAVRSLDAVARDAEVRWGIGKLESLADPELAARFEQARVRLNAALNGDDVNEVSLDARIWSKAGRSSRSVCVKPDTSQQICASGITRAMTAGLMRLCKTRLTQHSLRKALPRTH